jgi:hypothetical protein
MDWVGSKPTTSVLYPLSEMTAVEEEHIYNISYTKPSKVLVVIHESKSLLFQGARYG